MRRIAANESLKRFQLGKDVLAFAKIRENFLELESTRLNKKGASAQDQLAAAKSQIAVLKEDLIKAENHQKWLSDERSSMEERAKDAENKLIAALFRINQLTTQLKEGGVTADSNIKLPASWELFSDWCDENLSGRLLLSPRARREIKASPLYKDVRLRTH